MSTKLPIDVAKRVKQVVYESADAADYLAMARTDSGRFLDSLVANEDVGGVISQYVKKAQVRHYIKDAVLNRYSKDKTQEALPSDLPPILKEVYGFDCVESHKEDKLHLYRVSGPGRDGDYVVIAEGTYLKWETALRKALVFIAGKPFSETKGSIYVFLMLFAQHKKIAGSDKVSLARALEIANAKAYFFGEK